jgi:hypothetical protein
LAVFSYASRIAARVLTVEHLHIDSCCVCMCTVQQGGSYRVHIQNRASDQWYEVQDLHVQETMPQLIGLSESYIMIYRLKDSDSSSNSSSSAAR